MEIGYQKTYTKTVPVCNVCNTEIDEAGLCDYNCPNDSQVFRDPGAVTQRTWTITETLTEVKVV